MLTDTNHILWNYAEAANHVQYWERDPQTDLALRHNVSATRKGSSRCSARKMRAWETICGVPSFFYEKTTNIYQSSRR